MAQRHTLYFPVVILGVLNILLGLSVSTACGLSERAAPFSTPLEILPEWYFFCYIQLTPNTQLQIYRSTKHAIFTLVSSLTSLSGESSKIPEPISKTCYECYLHILRGLCYLAVLRFSSPSLNLYLYFKQLI